MLLQKLHIAYTEFTGYCQGKPLNWTISFEDVKLRLNTFNALNEELIAAESNYDFETIEQEITYYKVEKPEFQKYGMVYKMIYDIELKTRPVKIRYYKKQIKKLDKDFSEIEPYMIYYRSNSMINDDVYFRRSSEHNHIIALVKANELLVEYLTYKSGGKTDEELVKSWPNIKFKISQNDILEFSKGMLAIGAVEGTLIEVSEYIGKCFGVEMKNVYQKNNYIRSRLNPFSFTEKLLNGLKKALR